MCGRLSVIPGDVSTCDLRDRGAASQSHTANHIALVQYLPRDLVALQR